MNKIKVLCYGVRSDEISYFKKLNIYNYDLVLIPDFTITEKNIQLAKDCQAIMVRENVFLKKEHLKILKDYGVKYLLTRTAGFDHIDIKAAKELDFHSLQRVPVYSPNAIAELAITLAMTQLRKVQYTAEKTAHGYWDIDDNMLSKEIRMCKVGIIGTGKIGYVTAQLYKGLGAEIIGYDPFPKEEYKKLIKYVNLKTLAQEADVISIHCPLFESTRHIINKNLLKDVKNDVVIINVGRGALVNTPDVISFLKSHPKATFGSDVLEGEENLFFKTYKKDVPSQLKEVQDMYPQMIVTPHVGAVTRVALTHLIETSFKNLDLAIKNKDLPNKLF